VVKSFHRDLKERQANNAQPVWKSKKHYMILCDVICVQYKYNVFKKYFL
jgi:hypothetical protein